MQISLLYISTTQQLLSSWRVCVQMLTHHILARMHAPYADATCCIHVCRKL